MIRVERREPNFVAVIRDLDGRQHKEFYHADSETALGRRLEARRASGLIQSIVSVQRYDFSKWRAKAAAATAVVISAFEEGKGSGFVFDSSIWRELKDFLRVLFNGKCAYCEARFDHVAWGDVEHYRPKKRITNSNNVVLVLANGTPHPGYYWLAYEPSNLLPSCQLCNQAPGKLNEFPIGGPRAVGPTDELTVEDASLLNPYVDFPLEHLAFVPGIKEGVFGTVAGRTPRGEVSVKVYGLNREPLVEHRRQEQAAAVQAVKDALYRADKAALARTLGDYLDGVRPFSAAALAEVRAYFERMGLKSPLPTEGE